MLNGFREKSIMAKPNSSRWLLLCLICSALTACAIYPDYIDGSLPASDGLAQINIAKGAKYDSVSDSLLDMVLSTSNKSIANLNGQDWCDFFNGIHSLASSQRFKSGSVYERIVHEQTGVRKSEDDRSLNLGQRIFSWLIRAAMAPPEKPIDYRALNYAERLYRKSIVIGIQAGHAYSSDYGELADCYLTAGDTVAAEKAMSSYREDLASRESAGHWTIQANALSEDARRLEKENKLPEAEQKLKLLLSTYEAHEDLSPAGLEKMRQENIQWQKKYPGSSSTLHTSMALEQLADFYNRTGHPQEVVRLRQRLHELHNQIGFKPEDF